MSTHNIILNKNDEFYAKSRTCNGVSGVTPSLTYTLYGNLSNLINTNYNTILIRWNTTRNGYSDVIGITLPTDKTIDIRTDYIDQRDTILFGWDGQSTDTNSLGTNWAYSHEFNNDTLSLLALTGDTINNYGDLVRVTDGTFHYCGLRYSGYTTNNPPIIYSSVPLSHFTIDGYPLYTWSPSLQSQGNSGHAISHRY